MTRIILQNPFIVDGLANEPFRSDIAVENGKFVEISKGLKGDEYIDCSNTWITPGFIDCHVHLTVESFDLLQIIDTPFSMQFYHAQKNLQSTLAAGITFVRDAGGADSGIKYAVENGYIDGPNMQISINLISMTGGHADHWGLCGYPTPDFLEHPGRPDGVCDGQAGVLATTRKMIRAGADFVKICTTGGVLSPRDLPTDSQFLVEEIRAAVLAAAQTGKVVAAHAQGAEGIKNALHAGVWSIEHGSLIDEEGINLMLEKGAYLIPTLSALDWIIKDGDSRRKEEVDKAVKLASAHKASITKAIDAGVKVALGSDAGVGPHGKNMTELLHLVECGMTPLEAIKAGTLTSAEVLQISDERGSIEVDKYADFLMLNADPSKNIEALADGSAILSVWQEGLKKVSRDA